MMHNPARRSIPSVAHAICLWVLCFLTWAIQESHAASRPRLQILNGSDQEVEILWLSPGGDRIPNGSVRPGRNTIITTTLGHEFLVVGKKDGREERVRSLVLIQAHRFGGIPSFYTQQASAGGFPIVASGQVNPYALKEAVYIIDLMLAKRPDVRQAMVQSGARLCILAHNEFTTDQPEWEWLGRNPVPGFPDIPARDYRDARARGMGGSLTDPYCSCAEENLLAYEGDPYSTENILIHEFAHNMHLRGMVNVDPTFDDRLKATYQAAMKAGLWKGKYASVNHHEYFAEGVQSWFDNNRENDHDHNHVNTRAELVEYDPGLAAICREVFGDTRLKYTKPQTRLRDHLEGYDPSKAPRFAWPERLEEARRLIRQKAVERSKAAEARPTQASREVAVDIPKAKIDRITRLVSGWTLHIHSRLMTDEPDKTREALVLLERQLDEVVRVVPSAALEALREVPLYFSPQYPGNRPRAEYHPDAAWLAANGRDPVMARAVEFSNILVFREETNRMPNFALHELAHAYHHRVLKGGFGNPQVRAAYEAAKDGGRYDRVERHFGNGRPNTWEKAYAMNNPQEYFAETSEAFFSRNDFYPFVRSELKKHDPDMFLLLGQLWGAGAQP